MKTFKVTERIKRTYKINAETEEKAIYLYHEKLGVIELDIIEETNTTAIEIYPDETI